ncbi:MAG: glycosyltransferase family 4 protein [Planctomycetes bacterium]|nr:glycosyltransferase family 4 protein [Planctomycetota bacterium]
MTRILALSIRPLEGPDTRYRMIEYIPFLREAGITVQHRSLLSARFYARQQAGRLGAVDVAAFAGAVARRTAEILGRLDYDCIWLSRELLPYGPPFLERLLFRKGIPVVLDVDDALFAPDPLGDVLHRRLRDFGKFAVIAPRARSLVVSNRFLADYYAQFTSRIAVIPTCVDHRKYAGIRHRPDPAGRIRVGWIGTAANLGHLELMRGAMERLARRYPLEFRAVGPKRELHWNMEHARIIPWTLAEELEYFRDFDIGVMPLADTTFTRGKSSFKMIQCLAAGLPVVASPVGSNCETMVDGEHGFFATTNDDC